MDRLQRGVLAILPPRLATEVARFALAVTLIWLGVTGWTVAGSEIAAGWLTGHAILGGLDAGVAPFFAKAYGGAQALFGALLLLGPKMRRRAAFGIVLLSLAALSLLLTNPVWIDGLGGFPAIGAGQGIIKYLAILGLALHIAGESKPEGYSGFTAQLLGRSGTITLIGLFLVLAWIGAMKFTAPEAEGIDTLIRTSPVFDWMPGVFTLRETSAVIGVIEILTALALAARRLAPSVFLIGGFAAAATFVLTLSFLVTLPGWAEGGFPALSGSGVFLIKDLALLAATLVLMSQVAEGEG